MNRGTKIFLLRSTPGIAFLLMVGLLVRFGFTPEAGASSAPSYAYSSLHDAQPKPVPAPEFMGIETWLNGKPLTIKGLKGRVVLVDFWAYSCVNCVRTLPYLKAWDAKYRDAGLTIVGVHAPEFAFEKDPANVAAAIKKWGITYPVGLDNAMDTWRAYANKYWPAHYLIDREGRIVYTHFGEGKYDVTEQNIRVLLGLGAEKADVKKAALPFAEGQTPETYLGFARAQTYAGARPVAVNTPTQFTLPEQLSRNQWALGGRWSVSAQHVTAEEKGATLRLKFNARHVYLVLGTRDGKPASASVLLNGKPLGNSAGTDAKGGLLNVTNHSLYALVDQGASVEGELTITADAPGIEAYAFTFGS